MPDEPVDLRTARRALTETLAPGEDSDRVLEVATHLARRRAAALGRGVQEDDLKYALWMFCWWPGKTPPPPPVRKQLIAFRRRFSTRGRPALSESARTAALDRVVSDAALTQDLDWLSQQQREGISYLNAQDEDLSV
jgi:hypothetical protein